MTLVKRLSNREVKNKIIEIMVHFDNFCRKHNLKFYLCAGTLLGAVRHNGFIPWDDDVDVCMSRPQYDKLIGLIKKDDVFIVEKKYNCTKDVPNYTSDAPILKPELKELIES